jgi:hypothetical protein
MRETVFELQNLVKAFRRPKVLTKDQLLKATQCSNMTAWRLLRRHGYYTSYNCNARYYTLAGIPEFDQRGLWSLRGIRFSQWGSLTKTIIALVENSQAGMTPHELQQLLQVKNIRPALGRLVQQGRLDREKIDGRFVYFPVGDASERRQRRRQMDAPATLPPLEHVIALLVEIIQRPRNSPRQWARRLARQQIRLSTEDIRTVLDHYGIDRKKGLFTV